MAPNIPGVETVVCPNCGEAASSDDFTCPQCSMILNAAALESEPVSLVEALLSPTNATAARSGDAGSSRGNELTVRATILMDEFTVPRLLVGVDLALKPLHPFEAYVASFVDGRHSVPEIADAAEISRLEAMTILQTLAFRDVVELNRDEGRVRGEGDVPELDAEPKTDADGLSADQIEQARQQLAREAPQPVAHGRGPKPERATPAPPVFDPDALHAQMLAAAEAQLASAAAAFSGRPVVPAATGTPSRAVPSSPSAVPAPAAAGTPSRGVASRPSAASTAAGTPSRGVASRPSAASTGAGTPSRGVVSAPSAVPAAAARGGAAQPVAPRAQPMLLQDRPTPFQREQSVEYTLERAIAMERRGDLEGAIYILKKAIAQSRNAAPLYNKLALALVRRKEFSEAVPLLEKAVAIAPDDTTYQQNLYKVMGLAAASGRSPSGGKAGVLSRLLGRK